MSVIKTDQHKVQAVTRTTDYLALLQSKGCGEFRRTRQYPEGPLSQEEALFPIAFSILLYKDVKHVERLLRAIYQPQNVYCLHVDAKAPSSVQDAISALVKCFTNVFLASSMVQVLWGHFSVLLAELTCMKDLLHKHSHWKYFINLTGEEFPLKTNLELVRILSVYGGANDVWGFSPELVNLHLFRII